MAQKPIEYTEDQQPCLVAKKPCGHYFAASAIDADDFRTAVSCPDGWTRLVEDAQDFLKTPGVELEIRPVAFVRNGGLTFNCGCKRGRTL